MVSKSCAQKRSFWKGIRREIPLIAMLLPAVVLVVVFSYLPMFGIVMAFQNFNPALSFSRSPWVGLAHFRYLLSLPTFLNAMRNTVSIAAWKTVLSLVVPLAFAILINEVTQQHFKKFVQTSVLMPYFFSWTIMGGILMELVGLDGLVNRIISALGGTPIMFLGDNHWFRPLLIITDVWKGMGYSIIIFLAAITNVNPSLYEAAAIDGCGRLRQCWHVTLPGMRAIIVLVATLSIGSLLNAGFDQVLVMYNPLVYETGDIVDTFVYRVGLENGQLAISAAAGLFKNAVSLVLVGLAYYSAYRFSAYRIF